PDIQKNLVYGSLLVKSGFRLVFESDKFVLTKNGQFVGKGYVVKELFKMNVMLVFKTFEINKRLSSVYLLEFSSLWHCRLGHVNRVSLRKLSGLGLIPKLDTDEKHKCEIYVEAKFAKKSFSSTERSSKSLSLMYSDICDLKLVQSRGGKMYFITFIDDHTRYCYVYLLSSKDE
ncbi:hypothetical protein Pfo_007989, partial [Paulownia fortunei]